MSKESDLPLEIFNGIMEKDHFSKWMGIEALLIEEGHCKLKMLVRKEMLNGIGILHGGVAFAFADSALAFASNSFGRVAVTINGNIIFAKSANEGDTLIAEAKAINVTHKTVDLDINIYKENTQEVLYYVRGTAYRSSREYNSPDEA